MSLRKIQTIHHIHLDITKITGKIVNQKFFCFHSYADFLSHCCLDKGAARGQDLENDDLIDDLWARKDQEMDSDER